MVWSELGPPAAFFSILQSMPLREQWVISHMFPSEKPQYILKAMVESEEVNGKHRIEEYVVETHWLSSKWKLP